MQADAALPADVFPGPGRGGPPRVALLTGATGFLGRYAARALLRESGLLLVCLVRADDAEAARARLLPALARAGVSDAVQLARVRAVCGDIALPRLGMTATCYDALAATVDAVYHCAAEVNWARNYRQLRAVNVLGTLELLRFACARQAKPVLFVSTMAVCFADGHAGPVDEDSDLSGHIATMPLGYAQSKCVAETLCRQAAARGLPVTILRPALISGDSVSGDANPDDLIAALVEGCAACGAAMDADWLFDCVPVDHVAGVIARLPVAPPPGLEVLHLKHPDARHWREVVLWMNLYGCPVAFMPGSPWLDRAFVQGRTAGTRLYAYRRFFLGQGAGDGRIGTRPFEAYLGAHQQRIANDSTQRKLSALGLALPSLDSQLLRRYFEHYRRAGLLPRLAAHACHDDEADAAAHDLQRGLRARAGARRSPTVDAQRQRFAAANGILNEVSAIRLGAGIGIERCRLTVTLAAGRRALHLDALVKTKAVDTELEALTIEVAALCDPALGALFERHCDMLGLRGSHERELSLYELRDPRLRRHSPRCFGTGRDPGHGRWTLMLEHVADVGSDDIGAALGSWDQPALTAVVAGLASIQSTRGAAIDRLAAAGLLTPERSTAQMLAALPLWHALAAHAADLFRQWSPGLPLLQQRLIDSLADWWPQLLALPHTLIHNDFNPRNVALRRTPQGPRLCAFDWELAAFGLPQRDLAEFLCFVATEKTLDSGLVATLIEQHRLALANAASPGFDRDDFRRGFALALRQFVLVRLPLYMLAQRFRPQSFLPTVARNAALLLDATVGWLRRGNLGSMVNVRMSPIGLP